MLWSVSRAFHRNLISHRACFSTGFSVQVSSDSEVASWVLLKPFEGAVLQEADSQVQSTGCLLWTPGWARAVGEGFLRGRRVGSCCPLTVCPSARMARSSDVDGLRSEDSPRGARGAKAFRQRGQKVLHLRQALGTWLGVHHGCVLDAQVSLSAPGQVLRLPGYTEEN